MSHIAEYKSVLQKVDIELFKKAMMLVAKKLRATISDSIDSYDEGKNVKYLHNQKIEIAIRTTNLPQGIGVYFRNGVPIFMCDVLEIAERTTNLVRNELFHEIRKKSEQDQKLIHNEIKATYIALALSQVLQNRGYSTTSTPVDTGIVTRAVKKARQGSK